MQHDILFDQALPIEIQQLAQAHHLGELTASYPRKKLGIGRGLAWSVIVLLFLISPLALEGLFFFPNLAEINRYALLAMLGFDLAWYGILYAVLFPLYRNRRQQGYVFTEGFLCYGGAQTVLVRWEEIETVWRGTMGEDSISLNTLKIRKTDGQTISVGDSIRNAVQFCDHLEREYVARKLPGVIERYHAGAPLAFGKLIVSQQGLSKGNEILPWHEVERAEVSDRYVTIKKRGKWIGWFYNSVPRVPDACILRALLLYARPVQAYGTRTTGERFE